jgi:deoxyribonuclease V
MPLSLKRPIEIPLDESAARDLQTELGRALRPSLEFKHVAGVALAYTRGEATAHVAAVVLTTTTWAIVHSQQAVLPVVRRRESDYENFREAPLLLEVLVRLAIEPDLIFVEGYGIAHPRRFGVASHVGLALDHPTVGISDFFPSSCVGSSAHFPGSGGRAKRGSRSALHLSHGRHLVGYEVHTQPEDAPLYVSPGHKLNVEDAVELTLRASPWRRLPEPLHAAMIAASQARDAAEKG